MPSGCPACGAEVSKKPGKGRSQIYCSRRCQSRGKPYVSTVICRGCGTAFAPSTLRGGPRKFCTAECRRGFDAANPCLHSKTCQQCGKGFKGPIVRRFCSSQCASDSFKGRDAVRARVRHIAALQRRRMRLAQVPCEDFSVIEIFERDGWMCAICGHAVDKKLRYPDPMCASLEHRIPISRGGKHTWANVACSHLGCNVNKGNRLPSGIQARRERDRRRYRERRERERFSESSTSIITKFYS